MGSAARVFIGSVMLAFACTQTLGGETLAETSSELTAGAAVERAPSCSFPEVMDEDELEAFNGTVEGKPILVGYQSNVYDVTSAGSTYRPGGSYAIFAGRACTRGVALPSLKPRDVSDDLTDFNEEQWASVRQWRAFFDEKYPKVATLRADSLEERELRLARHDAARAARAAEGEAALAARLAKSAESGGRVFTSEELARHDGTSSALDGGSEANSSPPQILIALGGRVIDVTQARRGGGDAFWGGDAGNQGRRGRRQAGHGP